VLGVRTALAATSKLGLETLRSYKRLYIITETNGCYVDGIEVATGCTPGHRTLQIIDYGKIAATFIDVKSSKSIRVAPRNNIRKLAWDYAPRKEKRIYFAQLYAYKIMPDDVLLSFQEVELNTSIDKVISHPGIRTNCARCDEEIINEREIKRDGETFCRACAGQAYYKNL
jgi:formylmethanofuran dehydrogenase subunit E